MQATIETPQPVNEDQRLQALQRFGILDSEKEELFDDLAKLAAEICGTPVSLISLVDQDRLFLKSTVGIEATEMPRQGAFCSYTILNDDGLVVNDAHTDERFKDNLAAEEKGMRFYAGTPLKTRDGFNLGTLCILDSKPREIKEEQLKQLKVLARQVMSQIELRHNLGELAQTTRKAVALESLIKKYTSKSVWQKADLTVENGGLEITDEEMNATYLFLDVVGFTRLSEELGPSGTVELLNTYFKPIVDVIIDANGDIDKFVGDQLFCIFHKAEDAVKASLKIRDLLDDLNTERLRAQKLTLNFTMGLNAGHAIRANVGGLNRRDNTLIGNSVNIAARLQKACNPGGILIADRLFQQVKEQASSVKRVRLKLKNLNELVHAQYIEKAL